MIVGPLLLAITLFVAYSNGANDNFKGVATLYGSNAASYERAIAIGTVATFAGCVASVFLAQGLVQAFSGKGLVPDDVAASPVFVLAVASGAGATVIVATVLGLPVSTTHGLTGALVGAGFVAAGSALELNVLGGTFFLPLLVSPLLAIVLTIPLYKMAHAAALRLGVTKASCICLAPGHFVPEAQYRAPLAAAGAAGQPALLASVGVAPRCIDKYDGRVLGITAQSIVDCLHYHSAAVVSFARGLNDTPKIVALLLVAQGMAIELNMLAIACAMALGGWLSGRKVAQTMSKKISQMNDGQALTANLVTAFLVIFASRLGLPVSTTHVSVGAITGIGLVNGSAEKGVIGAILTAWLLVLPFAAITSAVGYLLLNAIL